MSKTKKAIIILTSIAASLIFIVASIFAFYLIRSKVIDRKNQKAAEAVINLISQIDVTQISIESENLLVSINGEYEALTIKQKSLVTNYDVLEKSFQTLQHLKDKKIANELVAEIGKINKITLTAENITVATLIDKYNALTAEQQALVSNYPLLLEYQQIVTQKIQELEQKNLGLELAENFEGYEGTWGNFGAHINQYQGLIEKALHKEATYVRLFKDPLNSLEFRVSRFEKDSTVFGIGICYYSFYGKDKNGGYTREYGEIVIKSDGSVYATSNGYY